MVFLGEPRIFPPATRLRGAHAANQRESVTPPGLFHQVLAGVLSGIPLGASAAAVDPPPPASGLLLPSPPVEPPPVAPPPRPPLPSPPPPTALSTLSRRAVLALIIVPELCAAGVVGCLIYRYCKARRRAREGKDVGGDDENMVVYDYEAEAGGSAFEGGSVKSSQVMPLPRGGSNSFRTQTALIPASSVVIKEQIGFGASAKVFRALWSGTTVAVKVWNETDTSIQRKVSGSMDLSFGKPLLLHVTASGLSVGSGEFTQLAQFRSEVQLLSNLRHPNILQFFGLVPPLTLVMEFGARGSLRTALDAAAAAGEKARPLSWETRMGIAAGVAAGMAFLHEQARRRRAKSGNERHSRGYGLLLARVASLRRLACPGAVGWLLPSARIQPLLTFPILIAAKPRRRRRQSSTGT